MFNSTDPSSDDVLEQILKKLANLSPEDRETVEFLVSFLLIRKTPWKRAVLSFVVNALLPTKALFRKTG